MRCERVKFQGGFLPALALWVFSAAVACAITGQLKVTVETNNVRSFERLCFRIDGPTNYTNPHDPDEVAVSLVVSGPAANVEVPAFWHQPYERKFVDNRDWVYPIGPAGWQARIAVPKPGEYWAVAVLKDRSGEVRSDAVRFTCTPGTRPGFVRVARADPRFLEFDDGTPFFGIGQNLAFIGAQQHFNLARAERAFSRIRENGANYLRIWTCCEDWALAIEARKSAWGRSWNWKPPFVPHPTRQGLKCPEVTANGLKCEPSHAVGLRADSGYVLTGKVKIEPAARLSIRFLNIVHEFTVHTNLNGDAWQEFRLTGRTKAGEQWLGALSFECTGGKPALLSDLSLKESGTGPELLWEADPNRLIRGFYNPVDSYLLDEVLASAERNGIYLQLCMLTRDLYMHSLKDPSSKAYSDAIETAKKFFRHAIARWGYSTSVAAWEYWNEMDPGLPTDRFYTELGSFLDATDPHRHLRTTSTWGPSAKDCRHPALDIADTHFYLRPAELHRFQDEVVAVRERTAWLREHAPMKPAHLGEFGLADDKFGITPQMRQSSNLSDVKHALWASALSGTSGAALGWWWERFDQHDGYKLYRPLSRFVADLPWNSGLIRLASVEPDGGLRCAGLTAGAQAWLWFFDPEASWRRVVLDKGTIQERKNLRARLRGFPQGVYKVEWFETAALQSISTGLLTSTNGALELVLPTFRVDVAARIRLN